MEEYNDKNDDEETFWMSRRALLHQYILMYNKIITSIHPHPMKKSIILGWKKMVLKMHEVVYFQKIHPFMRLYIL